MILKALERLHLLFTFLCLRSLSIVIANTFDTGRLYNLKGISLTEENLEIVRGNNINKINYNDIENVKLSKSGGVTIKVKNKFFRFRF
ncbi:Uncharacterised protein [Chlamydia trachomatis]|nr:Uncharacterised protein [Chlamydia trachomatis]CRH47117.1 Uncharacterised protein [Chlamydia trachomatis]CRH54973.1 Uncharacterised protein [Chlamydia trachomatis]CRH56790.1 Uncharacterised protein [Chlamydia trachomatis]